ncbi:MAG: calcium-binding protein [Candidatus Thiodiazotropha sp.]
MSQILPTSINDFNTTLRKTITKFEGDVRRIYVDHKGIPTMGVGFALFTRSVMANKVEHYAYRHGTQAGLDAELRSVGITLSAADWQRLDRVMAELNGGSVQNGQWVVDMGAIQNEILPAAGHEVNGVLDGSRNAFGFSLLTQHVEDLFSISIAEAKQAVKSKIGVSLFNQFTDSREMMAMTSLAMNNPVLLGSGFVKAFVTDSNRAEAWFQIRHKSNGGESDGIAKRRYLEASMFGLYNDPANVSDEEAEEVVQMLLAHRDKISEYESTNWSWVKNADGLSSTFKVSDIGSELLAIKDYVTRQYIPDEIRQKVDFSKLDSVLIGLYRKDLGNKIKGFYEDIPKNAHNELLVGVEGQANIIDGSFGNDVLVGADKVDELWGGSGDDVLVGKGDNDRLYGYVGNDQLYGGDGVDQLNGGAGDDKLTGGTGADRLEGGEGDDTYVAGDGDTILDTDGFGRVLFGDIVLSGGVSSSNSNVYQNQDGQATYTLVDSTLTVTGDAGTLTIENFNNLDLGIVLENNQPAPTVDPIGLLEGDSSAVTLSLGQAAGENGAVYELVVSEPDFLTLSGNGVEVLDAASGRYRVSVAAGASTLAVQANALADGK